ncbi:hypothetical protein RC74_17655 [Falsihalocynthiibacter arcticus]|uniref:Uncharacterized protein n=1 Tax=Falsihalocynthiibacter arcticus TaxID=1579316 RepID=A0A126V3D1_9RHOB|nr:hypothetical protein RC74_17655 [Falsihalocynthiibacter arcticus]
MKLVFGIGLQPMAKVKKTTGSRVSTARRVEDVVGDLDAILQSEGKEALLGRFSYSVDDQRREALIPRPCL